MSIPFESQYTGAEVELGIERAMALGVVRSFNIPDEASGGTVTGLNLPFTPTKVVPAVQIPNDSDPILMFACVVADTLTTDGFEFYLSGITNNANYKLIFLIAP